MSSYILLSFDIEEFDIPEEYGEKLEDKVKFEVSFNGLKVIISLLEQLNINATFFVTANFTAYHGSIIQEIASKHEIASHGFYHSSFRIEDLKKSRLFLEELTGNKVTGFRMPRLSKIDEREIKIAGYEYNSSINPTYIPGRYNNFFKPRTAYYSNNLLNIPVSVTPLIRFPLFWLSFKNLPFWLIKLMSKVTIQHDNYLNIYFHPWEFIDINSFSLPNYIKRYSGESMIIKLEKYLIWLKEQGDFIYFSEFKQKIIYNLLD
ncbi:polysaccharide deacetylase family protein [Fischerella sp. JS2]|uniref:polysaccharide deacetylase family protein n=1 Tax=Fischerella sp. JS2 TaxID=2597771 RepID=UPI0028EB5283|nr:polysaccharide deacetylase family protein [Fischerella sp. JS2]